MKYSVYGAFVSVLLVSPLFVAGGCSGSTEQGDACSVENARICSVERNEILICTNGVWTTDMACTDGTICEIRAEGPECVPNSGTGGTAGSGGTAGTGGTGAFAITPGHWSYFLSFTSVCLFVNEDGTKLVADPSCNQTENPMFPYAFQILANPAGDICGFGYPMEGDDPQEVPIVDNKFDIEQTRGDVTIKFSGEFSGSDSVGGVASTTMNCPEDVPWRASPGCCSRCTWCQ